MIKSIFMGTPQFAIPTLNALSEMTEVVAVICQPDKAKDRKGNFIFSPVKKAAEEKNIPCFQFEKIGRDGVSVIKSLNPDIIITCAYGQILSREILDIPKFGVINVHASVLPAYRGSSPLQWSLINGEKKTGVTIMKTDIGMDTGDILSIKEFDIDDEMYIDGLFDKASKEGAQLLSNTLPLYIAGKIDPVKQDEQKATKCVMIKKEDAEIDWSADNVTIRNKIRGIGYGYTDYNGENLKIYKLDLKNRSGNLGEVLIENGEIIVFCGAGAVSVKVLQLPNKKKLEVNEFLNGAKIKSGDVFK